MFRQGVKHVRFTDQNSFYSPPPCLSFPASRFTEAIAPGAGGDFGSNLMPSSISRHLVHRSSNCIRLHRYLEVSAISWNLLDPPTTITRSGCAIPGHIIREPATNPPRAFIAIFSTRLPWTIKVYASRSAYITLEDVFNAVYFSLRTNITRTEFYTLLSEDDRRRATRAYEYRYRRLRAEQLYQAEKYGGMKRIDFFMGRSSFLGFSSTCCMPDRWHINISW